MNSDTVWGNEPAFTSSLDGNGQTSRDEAIILNWVRNMFLRFLEFKEFHPNSPSLTWDVFFLCFVLVVWQVLFLSPPNLSQGQEGLQIWSASSPPPHPLPPPPPGFLFQASGVLRAGLPASPGRESKSDQHIPMVLNVRENVRIDFWSYVSYWISWWGSLKKKSLFFVVQGSWWPETHEESLSDIGHTVFRCPDRERKTHFWTFIGSTFQGGWTCIKPRKKTTFPPVISTMFQHSKIRHSSIFQQHP